MAAVSVYPEDYFYSILVSIRDKPFLPFAIVNENIRDTMPYHTFPKKT